MVAVPSVVGLVVMAAGVVALYAALHGVPKLLDVEPPSAFGAKSLKPVSYSSGGVQ